MRQIIVDITNNKITVTRKFAEKAMDPRSREYEELHRIMSDNPNLRVETHTIKKNPNKECYKGLNYSYMREYIKDHVAKANVEKALAKLEDEIKLSKCHTIRYPNVKKWFLNEYPEVAKFGTNEVEETKKTNVINLEETNKAA